ncbi:hypothetical protein DFH08DRAFT_811616 [Mycena albidolilacea]|uniref:Uncharacterized protein n=1 Tax=Mycena albidolilacea TaxID=1033008 RepID=A0AAD7EPD3_9AGAR|nr:hypothetical protein DFH08DRAFT_811616 [Mycena albidolilacea]
MAADADERAVRLGVVDTRCTYPPLPKTTQRPIQNVPMSLTLYTLKSDRAASTLNHRYGIDELSLGPALIVSLRPKYTMSLFVRCCALATWHWQTLRLPSQATFRSSRGIMGIPTSPSSRAIAQHISSPLYCAKDGLIRPAQCSESTTHLPSQWIGCFQTTLGKSNSTNELTPGPEIDSPISEKFATPQVTADGSTEGANQKIPVLGSF